MALDEIASSNAPLVLERLEDVVHGRESPGDPLGMGGLARHDAVPVEQRARERRTPIGVARALRPVRRSERPAALTPRWARARRAWMTQA